jgi:hypothetical protein
MQVRMAARRNMSFLAAPGRLAVFPLVSVLALLAGCGGVRVESQVRIDERTPIELTSEEAEHLRAGMRTYLASIQGIVEALPRSNMRTVATTARSAGMGMLDDIPISLVMKLPPGFVALSMETHQKFDALSRTAESSGTRSVVLQQLQEILASCTACHATYRISVQRP